MAFVCMTKKILPQTSKHHFSKSKGYHGLQGLLEAPLWSGAPGLLHSLLTHKALLLSVAFGASSSKEVNKTKKKSCHKNIHGATQKEQMNVDGTCLKGWFAQT